jgi:hypothetical protein
MIAHNPDLAQNKVQAFVTLTGSEAEIKASAPTDTLTHGLMNGRYIGFDMTFGISFDPQTRHVNLLPHSLQVGDRIISSAATSPYNSPTSTTSTNSSTSKAFMNSFTPSFNQQFNQGLRNNPDAANLLDQAKSIEIKDSELVIETQ